MEQTRRCPTLPRGLWARWAGCLLVVMVFGPARLYAQSTPVVETAVVLKASAYDVIAPEKRSQVESALSAFLAETLTYYFTYLRWAPSSNPEATDAAASFTVVVNEKPTSTDSVYWEIRLDYVGRIESEAEDRTLSGLLGDIVLFKFYEDKHADEPDMLQTAILDKLKEQLPSESFQNVLHDFFLKDIALSEDIEVDVAKNRLIIPIHWEALHAQRDSKLRAKFSAEHEDEPDTGSLAMSLDAPKTVMNSAKPVLYCIIEDFNFPGINLPAPINLSTTGSTIQQILNEPSRKWITIHMEEYIKSFNAGTEAALVVDNR